MSKKMTKEEKKAYKLTDEFKYKKYNRLVIGFNVGSLLSAIAPYIIYCGINYQELLIEVKEGWKLGTGAVTSLMMIGIICFAKVKKMTGGKFLALIMLLLGAYVSYCFGNFLMNLYEILLYGAIGIMVSYGFDYSSDISSIKRDNYIKGKKPDSIAKLGLKKFFKKRIKNEQINSQSKQEKEIPVE